MPAEVRFRSEDAIQTTSVAGIVRSDEAADRAPTSAGVHSFTPITIT